MSKKYGKVCSKDVMVGIFKISAYSVLVFDRPGFMRIIKVSFISAKKYPDPWEFWYLMRSITFLGH